MRVWLRLYRALMSLAPRFKREYGDEAARDYARIVDREGQRHGRLSSLWLALLGVADAGAVAVREVGSRIVVLPRGVGPDLRQALRIYRREPMAAFAVVATLTIAAGPTMAMATIVYNVLLAPLPYTESDRVVVVYRQNAQSNQRWGYAAGVRELREGVPAFASVAGFFSTVAFVDAGGPVERATVTRATAGALTQLGVPMLAGRDWTTGESRVAVVTRAFAESRLGTAGALGREFTLDGEPHVVIGVLESPPPTPNAQVYVPYPDAERPNASRGGGATLWMARLADEMTVSGAQAQAAAFASHLRDRRLLPADTSFRVVPVAEQLRASKARTLWILFGAVFAVLTIALISVFSLLVSRAIGRASDTSVRGALGASSIRLWRLWTLEVLVLAVPAAVAGIAGAFGVLDYLRLNLTTRVLDPQAFESRWPLVVAALAILVLATALLPLAPIVARSKSHAAALRASTRAVGGTRHARWQGGAIVAQIALSLTLIAVAGWLAASLGRLVSQPLGFDPDGVIVAATDPPWPRYMSRPAAAAYAGRVLERLETLSFDAVAITSAVPGRAAVSEYGPLRVRPDQPFAGRDDGPELYRYAVSPRYFELMDIPVVAGRVFTAQDAAAPERVIIVSRSFAARWFPEGAIGQIVSFTRDDRREVVGIVEDVQSETFGRALLPQFYVPWNEPSMGRPSTFMVRTSRPLRIVSAEIEHAVRAIDPTVPIKVDSLRQQMAVVIGPQRLSSAFAVAFGSIALALAVINVYALAAFAVAQRRREIGIRMALGARAGGTVRLVMGRGLALVACGIVLGLLAATAVAAPLVRSYLYDTRTSDPGFLVGAVAAVVVVALVALWIPARRAARIDPAITLKAE